jgi:hypothetical protein
MPRFRRDVVDERVEVARPLFVSAVQHAWPIEDNGRNPVGNFGVHRFEVHGSSPIHPTAPEGAGAGEEYARASVAVRKFGGTPPGHVPPTGLSACAFVRPVCSAPGPHYLVTGDPRGRPGATEQKTTTADVQTTHQLRSTMDGPLHRRRFLLLHLMLVERGLDEIVQLVAI